MVEREDESAGLLPRPPVSGLVVHSKGTACHRRQFQPTDGVFYHGPASLGKSICGGRKISLGAKLCRPWKSKCLSVFLAGSFRLPRQGVVVGCKSESLPFSSGVDRVDVGWCGRLFHRGSLASLFQARRAAGCPESEQCRLLPRLFVYFGIRKSVIVQMK